jgi:predicted membrane protein
MGFKDLHWALRGVIILAILLIVIYFVIPLLISLGALAYFGVGFSLPAILIGLVIIILLIYLGYGISKTKSKNKK